MCNWNSSGLYTLQITSAAIIMKSFAMLSIGDMELFDSIIDRVVQLLDTIPSQVDTDSHHDALNGFQDITCQALTLLSCLSQPHLVMMPNRNMERADESTTCQHLPQAATTFIWTCARAGHQHTAVFDGLAVHFVKQLQQGVPRSPSNIASVIYSCAIPLYPNTMQSM